MQVEIINQASNDNLTSGSGGSGQIFEQLQDREVWLSGQRRAFASALNDEPLRETLSILIDTATSALGEGTRAAFFLTGSDGATLHHIAGMSATGPSVHLDPQTALHLALVFHELGTNATKYGALSTPQGKVSIEWRFDNGLRIRWTERGGPSVEPATSQGFGTTLISQSVRGQGGEAHMTALSEGIIWDIMIPFAMQSSAPRPSVASAAKKMNSTIDVLDLKGCRVLVVEDEPLIGMDIVASLEDAGAEVEGPISTIEEACGIIRNANFDAVLVDANLHGRSIGDVAAALAEKDVPFAFATGYDKEGLPEAFRDRPVLSKPADPAKVVKMVSQLVAASRKIVEPTSS